MLKPLSLSCLLLLLTWLVSCSETSPQANATPLDKKVAAEAPAAKPLAQVEKTSPTPRAKVRLSLVGEGFEQVTDIQFWPGSNTRAFIAQKGGDLWDVTFVVDKKGYSKIASRKKIYTRKVRSTSEMGLLGVAFHPSFKKNGRVFINCNPKETKGLMTHVEELHYDAGTQKITPKGTLLAFAQPYQNHDGGQVMFGPDGYLYIGVGDGGSAGDPKGAGQDVTTLLGKMLRIDVNVKGTATTKYKIPKGNLVRKDKGAKKEIFAYGLRNPWKFSFSPEGDLIVADVGQNKYEEVNVVKAGDNMGWKVREGLHCFFPAEGCKSEGLVDPVFEYDHSEGNSVTGGYVYEGALLPQLKGKYIVGDFVTGKYWALKLNGQKKADFEVIGKFKVLTSTMGKSAAGEVFVGDFGSGKIFQLAPAL